MNPFKAFFHKGDVLLLALCILAGSGGLALIYTATRYNPNLHSCFLKQAVFLSMGVLLYLPVSCVDVEALVKRWWWAILLLGLAAIALLKPFGVDDDTGNRSWVYFPGLPVGFQPGEIAKLAYIPVMGYALTQRHSFVKAICLTVLVAGPLAYLSGDFGMVLVYLLLFIIMVWAGGLSKWWFIGLGTLGAALLSTLWFLVLPQTSLWNDYRVLRLRVVFDHSLSPTGVGWHQSRSLIAIGSGGTTGMGFLQGTQTQSLQSSSLPARHTDFIFSVCGEELGIVGCGLLLIMLLAVILRCLWTARRAKSLLSAYIAVGIGGMLMVQTLLNVGMCLYVTPVIGLTLPFFSYGGSSTLTLFLAMGMISSIKIHSLPGRRKDR